MAYTKLTLLAVAAALSLAQGSPLPGYGGVVVDAGLAGAAQSYSRISVPLAAAPAVASYAAPAVASYAAPAVASYAPAVASYAAPAVTTYAAPAIASYAAPAVAYSKVAEPEIIAYPRYAFKYGVQDGKTGDVKDQAEERDGDVVKGEYSLLQPDGRKRVVSYVSDKVNGFNAVVSYSGEAVYPQVVKVAPVQVTPIQVVPKVASYGSVLSSAY
ncbi:Cuticle protein 19 [Frankliniella fusca]|uniref:Cuticle protein 19 n=1 Tax=Frankliniella fusca TaxID=407009 RepID=A0AAE1GSF0_9NEOP|nr:Cuticle protein 19 [Frankliniella fusca]